MWYVSVPDGPELERLLTDGTGKLHGGSVPAGMVAAKPIAEMHAVARSELHPRFVELVQRSPDPFIQSIFGAQHLAGQRGLGVGKPARCSSAHLA